MSSVNVESDNTVSGSDIDRALLDSSMGLCSVNRQGLISYRSGLSYGVSDFMSWYRPSYYGRDLSLSSYRKVLEFCGYAGVSDRDILDRLVSLRESWESEFISHCEVVGKYRDIKMVDRHGVRVGLRRVRSLLVKHGKYSLLVGVGCLYTEKSFKEYLSSVGVVVDFSWKEVFGYVWETDIEAMLFEVRSYPFRAVGDLVAHLNSCGYVTKTGKKITNGSLNVLFSEIGFSVRDHKASREVAAENLVGRPRGRSQETLAWYRQVHAKYCEAIESDCYSLNEIMSYWERVGFKTSRGNKWSRWSLRLIQMAMVDLDWEIPPRPNVLLEKFWSVWEEGKYSTISELCSDLSCSYTEARNILDSLGLDIDFHSQRDYVAWTEMVLESVVGDILLSGTGLSRIGKYLEERGVPTSFDSENTNWYASTVERTLELIGADRFEIYRSEFLVRFPSVPSLDDLVGVYPPRVRGRFPKWNIRILRGLYE